MLCLKLKQNVTHCDKKYTACFFLIEIDTLTVELMCTNFSHEIGRK